MHNFAIGGDDCQSEYVILHRAVSDCAGAGGARRRHAAEGGIGTRVNREMQFRPDVGEMRVELQARDTGLDGGIPVAFADVEDVIHVFE